MILPKRSFLVAINIKIMPDIFEQYYTLFIPKTIKVLFIAESPPSFEGEIPTKYFFMKETVGAEPLFSTIMLAVYNIRYKRNPEYKLELLNRFRDDGYYLMDAVEYPINTNEYQIEHEIKINKSRFIERISELRHSGRITNNTKVILIKKSVYNVYKNLMELNILNNDFIAFPFWCNNEKIANQIRSLLRNYKKND